MKKIITFIVGFSAAILSFAEDKNSSIIDFYRGNIKDKISVVKRAADSGDSSVAVKAIEFLIDTNDVLSNDEDYNSLAEISIRSFNSRNTVGFEKQISSRLCSLFKMTDSQRVKTAVIDFFNVMPSVEAVQMVNDFFYKKMQNHNPVDDTVVKAVEFMGAKGNAASFNRLFIADILEVWPEFSPKIAECYGNLAEDNRREILQMIVSVPADKKIVILNKLNANPKISKKICGECAENVLSAVINKSEEVKSREKKEDLVTLELLCLETVAESKWTRASAVATKSFERIRSEYELKDITDDQFTKAISNIASVANSDTVVVLSSYLDFLNKSTESGRAPVKGVVLSVINSLGELGDNRAFDFIYAATSLEYPDEVVEAAKSAITKLKW
ncbi:hypothetical protein [Treponema sp.]|uniref:hypothetical protein n=1 Tax=Treponema sp. TaxID=166 RepID=UPI00298E9EAC|nr:hypothetical protein [Treponema sp.]MCQ2240632.1 hypothetical protein [Treponema sp.]